MEPGSHLRHELRTRLNHIINYTEMLVEDAQEMGGDRLLPDLGRVQDSARGMLELVDRHIDGAVTATDGAMTDIAATLEDLEQHAATVDGATLLVVDDNELNRDLLVRRLRDHGFQVRTAAGGREALASVERDPPDLVLLDVLMPDITGLDVLKTLRARHSMADMPVIMATALRHSADTVRALRTGANDYVTKPLDFTVVLARIQNQLALKRARAEIENLAGQLEARNAFIRSVLDRYVSEEVAGSLLDSPDGLRLGGERRVITVLMADLRGFTSHTQWMPPEDVVRMLNRYLGRMAEIVHKYHGTVDEFIGDAILALFGAPLRRVDDAQRAVACAIEMQRAMESINQENGREGLPHLAMGIAVHTGDVVVGSIGSSQRAKYGAVGSAVNLTARIESCTVGGQVLISRSTLDAAGDIVRVGDRITVQAKGFDQAVDVFDLRGIRGSYLLFMPERKVVMRPLEREVMVTAWRMSAKQVDGDALHGAIVALAPDEAALRLTEEVPPLSNLRLHLLGFDGNAVPGDLYAKVMGQDQGLTRVRFTAVPPDAERFLDIALSVASQRVRPR